MVVRPPMVALLAIWLRSLSMLAKKNVCTTSYGSAPGNMVASINLATAKKIAPGNMIASILINIMVALYLLNKTVAPLYPM
jgi:hypothetical protein